MYPQNSAVAQIRFMNQQDFAEVLNIEQRCFYFPWTKDVFKQNFSDRNVVGLVVTRDNNLVGYAVIEVFKSNINIRNLAVVPSYRRQKIGKLILDYLKNRMKPETTCTIYVRESNLSAHLFLKDQGFRAVSVVRDYFQEFTSHNEEPDFVEDAYKFRFEMERSDA